MKNIILYLSIVFIFACSDEKSNNVNSNEEEYFELKGKVLENGTYNPIPNVLIKTIPNSEILISDENGEFSFIGLKDTEYLIYSESLDYYESYITVNSKSSDKIEFILNKTVEANIAPSKPKIYNINNTLIDGNLNTYLSWHCNDDKEGNLYFDILVDTQNPPRKIYKKNITDNFIYIKNEDISNKYYYQIIAKDEEGASNKSLAVEYINQNEKLINEFDANEIFRLSLDNDYFWYEKFGGHLTYEKDSSYSLSEDRYLKKDKAAYYKYRLSSKKVLNDLNWNEEFSISLWVKYDYLSENKLNAIFYTQKNNVSNVKSFDMSINNSGKIIFQINESYLLLSKNSIENNLWNHLVLSVKNNVIQLYINGQFEKDLILDTPLKIEKYINIGSIPNQSSEFIGYLDDIIFFDKALGIDRIRDLYNN